jgi:hypothetical protein
MLIEPVSLLIFSPVLIDGDGGSENGVLGMRMK